MLYFGKINMKIYKNNKVKDKENLNKLKIIKNKCKS